MYAPACMHCGLVRALFCGVLHIRNPAVRAGQTAPGIGGGGGTPHAIAIGGGLSAGGRGGCVGGGLGCRLGCRRCGGCRCWLGGWYGGWCDGGGCCWSGGWCGGGIAPASRQQHGQQCGCSHQLNRRFHNILPKSLCSKEVYPQASKSYISQEISHCYFLLFVYNMRRKKTTT